MLLQLMHITRDTVVPEYIVQILILKEYCFVHLLGLYRIKLMGWSLTILQPTSACDVDSKGRYCLVPSRVTSSIVAEG